MSDNTAQDSTTRNKDHSILQTQNRQKESFHFDIQRETLTGTTHNKTEHELAEGDLGGKEVGNKKEYAPMTKELKQAKFLIAESEPEILSLFKTYLDSLGVKSVTVDNGNQALDTFLQGKNEGNEYDAVVLDTHLKGKTGLDLAKAIRERDSTQKIILVTTSMKEQLPKEDLQSAAIDEKDILVMPFALSCLSNLLINAP